MSFKHGCIRGTFLCNNSRLIDSRQNNTNNKKKTSGMRRRLEYIECLFVKHTSPTITICIASETLQNW